MRGPRGSIEDNVLAVREAVASACRRVGRDPAEVTLLAVTKNVPAEAVLRAVAAGVRVLGENRVQEAESKVVEVAALLEAGMSTRAGADRDLTDRPVPMRPQWHMIGRLQRNKVGRALRLFDCIQSVDSLALAREISRRAALRPDGLPVRVLVEVKTSPEQTKLGVSPDSLWEFVCEAAAMPGLRIEGLMTVAPYSDDPEAARPYFRRLRELARSVASRLDELPRAIDGGSGKAAGSGCNVTMDVLSMGMSGDFEVAVEEGSTMVRVGTAIFGPRPVTGQTP